MERFLQVFTQKLWDKQNQNPDDGFRLFRAVGKVIAPNTVLYAGSFVDISPSFVFPSVTYVDMDKRAKRFFDDKVGVREIIEAHNSALPSVQFSFINSDYAQLTLPAQSFDLLVSLYAGFISEYCTNFLRIGGHLLVNPSHGDAALASLDKRYLLVGVVVSRSGDYDVLQSNLTDYLQPEKAVEVTRASLFSSNRGIAYTRNAFAYIFERVS